MTSLTKKIPVAGPWITGREISYVADAAANDWYENAGRYAGMFERAFAGYVGVRHAVALPSCTSAIHLSLAALGVGPGDEVIVPDITWIATAAPVAYMGATPVFADIDPVTWCVDPQSIESLITPVTKAIIAVDLYGGMCDFDSISALAARHGIAVIEDAAEAVGSEYRGQRAGSLGKVGVFSFHGSKTLTTGEGGMLVTDDTALFERILFLRDHGRPPGDRMFFNAEVAYKYRMSSMQAAMGLAQLERIDELVGRKREIFRMYTDRLGGRSDIALNHEPTGTRNSYWMTTAVIDERREMGKERLMALMDARGVDCRPFFHPLSSLPAYRNHPEAVKARNRNAQGYSISPRGINLPGAMNLKADDVDYVCDALLSALEGCS
ncbi:MAG: DegT/DnrJ/EryC1/StrS family aminotransferase [Nitrospirae bacterium]|nr:DegT/DnrJ/EryC1/StrS family aminotransferase [Nitrospirota bacterium]